MLTHVLTAARRHVSELDHLKEQVAYLKVWLGIVVVTDISLAGWLISSSESAASLTFVLALAGLVLLSAGIVVLHRRIERRIDRMREL
jgi:heme O synthase-like polyprenyltransferase